MISPRIRTELNATPVEHEGVAFFDVSDPRSGVTMRLYNHEWQLAYQMDGQLSLEEIASWANDVMELEVTAAILKEYADRLNELGFLAVADGAAQVPHVAPSMPAAAALDEPEVTIDAGDELQVEVSTEEVEQVTEQQAILPPRDEATPIPAPMPPAPTISTPAISAAVRSDATERSLPTTPASAPPTATARPDEVTAPPKSSSSKAFLGLLLVLLIIGGVVAWVMFMGTGAKVSTQVVARTRPVVALYDGSTKLTAAQGKALAFGEGGKIADIVAAGTAVKEGQALATLEGYAKVEKELSDVKDRLAFYQGALEKATAKGDAAAQKAAEDKVAEKKKIVAELEARAGKLRLVAPGPGTVEKVDVANGADVKADAPVVEMADNRVIAVFTLPGAAVASIKVGDEATLQDMKGATATGKVAKVDGGAVTVELGEGSTLKAGDEARLVRSKLNNVAVIPASAVVKKDGGDVVFVLSGGVAHEKKVTIADRTGGEVYVSSGLQAGDQVVTSGGETLHDGDKASASE